MEPARRRVFEIVASADEPLTREQVAVASGLSLSLATFHLERLLESGLLEANVEEVASARPGGAAGPRRQRGRPAKRYRVARREIAVTVPARDYRLAAELFADALAAHERPPSLDEAARERGRTMGGAVSGRAELLDVLVGIGYEPRLVDGDAVTLRNCPFDGLTARHRDLVCPTNLAFLEGLVAGAAATGLEARLEPGDGRCCVVLHPVDRDHRPAP